MKFTTDDHTYYFADGIRIQPLNDRPLWRWRFSFIHKLTCYIVTTAVERNFELKWRHVAYALWATGETWHGGVDSSSPNVTPVGPRLE